MIEGLKNDDIIRMAGGRFRLTALIQRRLVEIMQGERPLVDTRGLTELEVVVQEILDGKIEPISPEDTIEDEDLEDDVSE